jgi:transcriptional regulator with XRE-family HTH domain
MTILELRTALGLTQEDFARAVGLTSKSYVSELESGGVLRCSVRVALEIERLSEGQIPADSLNPDVGLVRGAEPAQSAA